MDSKDKPLTGNTNPYWLRSRLVSAVVMLGWMLMIARLIHLQGSQHQLLNTKVARQSTFSETVPARPGEILDRNGHVLAMTVTRDSLYAVPSEIEDPRAFVWAISDALDVNVDLLFRRITDSPDKHFIWVKRRLEEEEVDRVRSLQLPKRAWGFRREYLRQYPQGQYAAHVLGMRDIDNIGHGGLEQSLDQDIRGRDGRRTMSRDARGLVVEVAMERSIAPRHGRTVITTLDVLTQIRVERELSELMQRWNPLGACVVVMEPHSGEVLAMASAPTFNPNRPGSVPEDAWKNLAVSAVFEPGSTFKPFIVGWAMQHDVLQFDERIKCFNGAYRMGRRILHDHHAYSELSVEDVLVKSSNIGMARIGERLGLEGLHQATATFGFGRRTGIELPGEIDGLVRRRDLWDEYSIGSIPMGQEIAVTPLQLITAHAALANGGRLVRPRLLMGTGEDSTPTPLNHIETVDATPAIETSILRPDIAQWLVAGPMKNVVERGTAKSARTPGISMFGKTGTAQKPDPETGGYSHSRHVCSFICGAPAENPQVLVLVMVDEPRAPGAHYGGSVAAPTGAKVLQYALQRILHLSHRLTIRPEHDLPPTRVR
ncbi:MAG: penicillin-binding protein 2 [Planctomycetaceae bacterium]|nr:penicillin-binding protein 2 [Planctomycetaceae bacterium]